jgi:hypothetical protein
MKRSWPDFMNYPGIWQEDRGKLRNTSVAEIRALILLPVFEWATTAGLLLCVLFTCLWLTDPVVSGTTHIASYATMIDG